MSVATVPATGGPIHPVNMHVLAYFFESGGTADRVTTDYKRLIMVINTLFSPTINYQHGPIYCASLDRALHVPFL